VFPVGIGLRDPRYWAAIAWSLLRLRTVWSFVDQGNVEGKFCIAALGFGLLPGCFPFVLFGYYGSLGIQT
jgi:hypothetical protein